jgi:hypothetical protein
MDLLGLGLLLWDFATWLQMGDNGGMYRRHVISFQLQASQRRTSRQIRSVQPPVRDWRRSGRHIVIAAPDPYLIEVSRHTGLDSGHIDALARITDRQLVIRDKKSKRSLQSNLDGAHVLVPHGSIAAVESVILGCPVFVHPDSAAALVGRTDLSLVEKPAFPDLDRWLWSLAHSQFDEKELVDGTLWKLIV